jgi:flavin reductase (DIM6/NTAB) family NADH-FMN oxidoreductase RutF
VLADSQLTMCPFSSTTTDVPDIDDMAAPSWRLVNDFRQGIGHLARGVTVLTTSDKHGERYGVTTTGVCVLSVDPPTLVVCVRRRSKLGTHLPHTRRFCVNILSGRQRTVAEAFAGRLGLPVDRFNHGQWTTGVTGSPILADALASFECEVDLLYGYPNHMIVVGSICNVVLSPERLDPLVYASGQLSSLTPSGNAAVAAPV